MTRQSWNDWIHLNRRKRRRNSAHRDTNPLRSKLHVERLESRRMLAAGDLDTTFDTDGWTTTPFGSGGSDVASSVVMQSDGKFVVAGSHVGTTLDFALARYNFNGSLDTSFGTGGKVTTHFSGTSGDVIHAVAIQTDGKIVAVGESGPASPTRDFAIARYNSNGTLDTSFSDDGLLTFGFGTSNDIALGVAIQADGKIVVAGFTSLTGTTTDFALARLNPNGSFDSSFDFDGKVTTTFPGNSGGRSMALQADGKIVVAGWNAMPTTGRDFAVARYNTDGSLDTSFDFDGMVTTDVVGSVDTVYSVALQADGRIVVAGEGGNSGSQDFALVRYNTDGSLDTTFDLDGKLKTSFGTRDIANSIAIQPDGKIVAVGTTPDGSNDQIAVARYNNNGALDTSFSGDGKLTSSFGTGSDVANEVLIQTDGRIVVVGSVENASGVDFGIARYKGFTPTGPQTFVVDTLIDEFDGNFLAGDLSLREAIDLANLDSGFVDTIEFAASLTSGGPATIALNSGQLHIRESVTINGPGADLLTIKAFDPDASGTNDGDGSRVFLVDDGRVSFIDVMISGLTLTNGDVNYGAGILSLENTSVIDCKFIGNAATLAGGGIYFGGGELNVDGSIFQNNSAPYGGAISQTTGKAVIFDSTLSANSASTMGGAIHLQNAELKITSSSISGNMSISGGGVANLNGNLEIETSGINDNEAQYGGGISNQAGVLSITDSEVIGNQATLYGAGIFTRHGDTTEEVSELTITRTTVANNTGSFVGGGVLAFYTNATIAASTISGNATQRQGGGLYNRGGYMQVSDSTISGNSAIGFNSGQPVGMGGGIFSAFGDTYVIGSTISGNFANYGGGGVAQSEDGATSIQHTTITGNVASSTRGGGALAIFDGLIYFGSTIISGNANRDVNTSFDGFVVSDGYNLVGTANAMGAFNQAGDQTGITNPLLGPLADNGGPTLTHALLANSPAINAGNPSFASLPTYDQRGAPFDRVSGGRIDIGAFEYVFNPPLTLVVDTPLDENDGNYSAGNLSLREAIGLANANNAADTIVFDAGVFGVAQEIDLSMGELTISDALTINGPGQELLTIDGQQLSRIFNITATTGDFVFSGLTLTRGRTLAFDAGGGAIRSMTTGNLTIDQSAIRGNYTFGHFSPGGAIFASGNVTITDSILSDNSTAGFQAGGGGIRSFGTVMLTRSVVHDNHVTGPESGGGGISAVNVTLLNTTVSGNSAEGDFSYGGGGGGINASTVESISSTISGNTVTGISGFGGGVLASYATLTNSTVSGNRTTGYHGDGGGIRAFSELTLTHSTVTDNHTEHEISSGGGIWADYDLTISNSIVAGNTAGFENPDVMPGVGMVNINYSLIGNTAGTVIGNTGVGNLLNVNPMLAPLADNGGPTQTHALLLGSPAINAGNPSFVPPPANDQRGAPVARVSGGRIDIGAYEAQVFVPSELVVDNLVDESDFDFSAGDLSLREAIELANSNLVATNTITFAPSLTSSGPAKILLTIGELSITDGLSINGPGAHLLTIDASGKDSTPQENEGNGSRVFSVGASVSISGVTLTGGDVTGDGGAIYVTASALFVTLNDVAVVGNAASGRGGGIFSNGIPTIISIQRSRFSQNVAGGSGGGIYVQNGELTMLSSTLDDNSAGGMGGGAFLDPSGFLYQISSSTISGNHANYGGGISFNAFPMPGGGSDSAGSGSAPTEYDNALRIVHTTIARNSATTHGGGIWTEYPGNLELDHTIVAENKAGTTPQDVTGGVKANWSLIGTNSGTTFLSGSANNLVNQEAKLGPLTANGGLILTHTLLAGSPAIDTGNPSLFGAPSTDQRGTGFARIVDGNGDSTARIDIGAIERQNPGVPQTLVVDILVDESDGNFSAGDLSLREAIALANANVAVADTITFSAALAGGTIRLRYGELVVSDALTINGLGSALLTIDASGNDFDPLQDLGDGSRIFFVSDGDDDNVIDVMIAGLTLIGGDVRGNGGAIRSSENLEVSECTIDGNAARGFGGGIASFVGELKVADSTISGNNAVGVDYGGYGGGGGGISAFNYLSLIRSTVSGNSSFRHGGGIFSYGNLAVADSTISGNNAVGFDYGMYGGGIAIRVARPELLPELQSGNAVIKNSTISSNSGGGLAVGTRAGQSVTLAHSTVTLNIPGGGIRFFPESAGVTNLNHTIVAVNETDVFGAVTAEFSLVGDDTGATITGTEGNQIGNATSPLDPNLGPLADNGGPTQTHALLAGSPAINAGNPAVASPPQYDQRGTPFLRVADGRIDMGAFEVQTAAPALPGDYNRDEIVDAADYVLWRHTLDTTGVPAFSGADGSGNTAIGEEDYAVWTANFGETLPLEGGGAAVWSSIGGQELGDNAEPAASMSMTASLPDSRALTEIDRLPDFKSAAASRPTIQVWLSARADSTMKQFDEALMAWLASQMVHVLDGNSGENRALTESAEADDSGSGLGQESLDAVFALLAM